MRLALFAVYLLFGWRLVEKYFGAYRIPVHGHTESLMQINEGGISDFIPFFKGYVF